MPFLLSILSKSSSRIPLCKDLNYSKLNSVNFPKGGCICLTARSSENSNGNKKGNIILPPEPQECCMSGCANCVWIKYGEEVAKQLGDGGEFAKAEIIKNVKDPNLRAFLLIELNHLFDKKDENIK